MDSQVSLLLYRYLFMLGMIFEPCWGFFLETSHPEFNESMPLRIFAGVVCGISSAITFNKKLYDKYSFYSILMMVIVFNGERLYLLSMNADNWYYIMDAYTITILSIIVAPTKRFLIYYSLFILSASIFFPAHDYALLTNNISIIPLISSLKYALFSVIDKLKETLSELHKAQAKLKNQSVLEGAKTLISNLSHDINNNLAKVSLNSAMVHGMTDNTDIQSRMAAIQQEVSKTAKIITSFKDLVIMGPVNIEKISLSKMIDDVVGFQKDRIITEKINLINNVPDLKIECDQKIIKQCLSQILKNSVDAVLELSIDSKKEIFIKYENDKNEHKIIVANNGPMILESQSDLIFDAFFTTKSVGYGFGLGLTIARELIENHNGSINFASNPEITTFTICFKK